MAQRPDAGLFDSITSMSNSLGNEVGQDFYGQQISNVQHQIAGGGKGGKSADARDSYTFNFYGDVTDPDALVTKVEQGLAKKKRHKGGGKLAFEF